MTTTISTHRNAIKALVATVDGIRAFDYAPASPPFPTAVIGFPTEYDPHATFGGGRDLTIPVTVYVGYGNTRAAEDQLEAFIDPIVDAIETTPAYQVAGVRNFSVESVNDTPVALSCQIMVSVFA